MISGPMGTNPINQIGELTENLFFKIKGVFSTTIGWFFMLTTFMASTFGPEADLVYWVTGSIFADLFMGAWSAIKMKKFHISYALSSTAIKLVMYLIIFYMPLVIDKVVSPDLSLFTEVTAAILCSAGFFSMLAHMLIIKPDLMVIKLIQKALMTEISRKIGCKPEEVEEYLIKHK